MNPKRAVLALKILLWISALAPATWLTVGYFQGWLGANPIEKMTRWTGMTAIVLLLVTLAVTPIRRLTGWNPIIKLRRPLGLFAFFYGVLHFSVWFVFDSLFDFGYMFEDIMERKYITVGMAALVIMLPLAITSTTGWIRRLGKRWTRLHQASYVAAGLAVLHYFWLVKAFPRLPITFGVILVVLLALRHPRFARKKKSRPKASKSDAPATA
ncbi:MAG: protein-methionine-sulfoxide reductase heme-binding subunit MsrQ [Gemmatimonadota bacterium]